MSHAATEHVAHVPLYSCIGINALRILVGGGGAQYRLVRRLQTQQHASRRLGYAPSRVRTHDSVGTGFTLSNRRISEIESSVPHRGQYSACPRTGAHPASYPMRTGVGLEAHHSPTSSAKVRNAWSFTSTSPCLHGVDNLSFYRNSEKNVRTRTF
jgi:hypothetical protein